jgi:phosphopantothenate---cysteine ligase (ATP)
MICIAAHSELFSYRKDFSFPRLEKKKRPNPPLSDSFVEYWLRIDIPEDSNPGVHMKEIEEDIVLELVTRHAEWIKNAQKP